jgi:putative ABC transport system permease protein
VAQVGLALVVLVGGGLLLRSLSRLLAVDPGFEPRGVLSLKVFLGPPRYRLLPSQHGYVRDALARLEQLPGVSSVAAVSHLPLSGLTSRQRFEVEGRPAPAGEAPSASYRAVSASYFRTLRIPLRRGRELGEGDTADSPPVLVVNESMARRCWPGEDPLGRRVRWMGGPDPRWLTVVGVVADVRSEGLHASEGLVAYAPYTQRRFPWLRWTSFAVRTDGDPLALAGAVRAALARLDPEQPVYEVASLEEVVSRSLAERRFHALTLQAFAALGLALAALGVYGVVAYDVRERTAEIGLRMALGAQKGDVLRLVLRQGLLLALAGVALGTAGAVAAARALAPMLFEVTATDPLTYAGMAGVLVASALVACAVPAARAARLDPLQALR